MKLYKILKQLVSKNVTIFLVLVFIFSLVIFSNTHNSSAAINPLVSFNGKVTNSDGTAVTAGVYNMSFGLYTAPTGGVAIWSEDLTAATRFSATITNVTSNATSITYTYGTDSNESTLKVGQYLTSTTNTSLAETIVGVDTTANTVTVTNTAAAWAIGVGINNRPRVVDSLIEENVGTVGDLTAVNFNQPLYLEVAFNGETMQPRKPITSVEQAFNADKLDGLDSTDFLRATGGTVGGQLDLGDLLNVATTSTSTALTVTQNGTGNIVDLFSGADKVFTVLANGYVGIGTSTPDALLTVNGTIKASSLIINGQATLGTSGQNVTLNSSLIPSTAGLNLGSSENHWANMYVDNLSVASTSINGTLSEYFIINSDAASDENSGLRFYRGSDLNGYAALVWNSVGQRFDLYKKESSATYADLNLGNINAGAGTLVTLNGNVGIGTTSPLALLSVGNSSSFQVNTSGIIGLGGPTPLFSMGVDTSDSNKFKIAAGSSITGTSQFTIDQNGVTSISNLEMGELSFADNAGAVTWVDMGVTSAAPDNTIERYTAMLDSNPMLTIYGLSDGIGSVDNLGVGIGTTTPTYGLLDINGNLALENQSEIRFYQTRGTSNYYAGFKASSTAMTGNTIWSLPNADGTAGKILATNGSGSLYWANGGATSQALAKGNFLVGDDSGLSQATSTIFLSSIGSLGIGTTTPNQKLSIFSSASDSAIELSSAAGSSYKWTMGMDYSDAGKFKIASSSALGTSDRFVIDGNGNVGIGTTNPGTALQVAGEISPSADMSYSLGDATHKFTTGYFNGVYVGGGNGLYNPNGVTSGQISFLGTSGTDGLIRFNVNSTPQLAITNSGVGIGTTTPLAKLDVYGDLMVSGPNRYINFNYATSSLGYGFRDNNGTIQYKNLSGSWSDLTSIDGGGNGIINSGTAGQLSFYLADGNTLSGTSTIYINPLTGNVGIGTSSPSSLLEISGASNQLRITNSTSKKYSYLEKGSDAFTLYNNITQYSGSLNSWTAADSDRNWMSVALSSDGTKQTATVDGGRIYTSTDSGGTWTPRDSDRSWRGVAMSADGTKRAAVAYGDYVYTSADSGATWTPRINDQIRWWSAVAVSADGTKQTAVDGVGYIYTSADSGASWTPRLTDTMRNWSAVAMSADGTKQTAVNSNEYKLYVSTNSGQSWTVKATVGAWTSVAMSSDGTKQTATVNNGQIYTSSDSGETWTPRDSARAWYSVSMSADGVNQTAVVYGGQIYTSSDSGVTWTPRESNRNWRGVAMSADGSSQSATTYGGKIYTVNTNGVSKNVALITSQSYADGTDEGIATFGHGLGQTVINGSALTFDINGAAYAKLNSSGYFGIGTTSPYSRLSVWGSGTSSNRLFELNNNASTTLMYMTEAGNLNIPVATATTTIGGGLNVAGASGLTVLQNGYVGIGTTGPLGTLQIGNAGSANENSEIIFAKGNAQDAASTLSFNMNVGGGNSNSVMGQIKGVGDAYGSFNNQLQFFAGAWNNNNNAGSPVMVIQSNGNVGIGTTSPNNLLSLYSATKAGLEFSGASGSANKWTMGLDMADGGKFKIASSTALGTSDRFVIDGNGYVGVGVSNPSYLFQVRQGNSNVETNESVTQTSDTDFNFGTLTNTEISGSGSGASLRLKSSTTPGTFFSSGTYVSKIFDAGPTNGSYGSISWNATGSVASVSDADAIASYHFDEGVGVSAADSSTYGNNSVGFVGSPAWVAGKGGYALNFNNNGYVNFGNQEILKSISRANQNYSISAWMKTSVSSKMICKYTPLQMTLESGNAAVYINNGSSFILGGGYQAGGTTVSDNQWHNIVWTVNRGGYSKVYVDGRSDAAAIDISSHAAENWDETQNLQIGACQTGHNFTGTIDEVKIFNKELSLTEVQDIYYAKFYKIKVRTFNSADASDAPAWSSCNSVTSGQSLSTNNCVSNGDRYIQYEVELQTTDSLSSPEIYDLSFDYNYQGTTGSYGLTMGSLNGIGDSVAKYYSIGDVNTISTGYAFYVRNGSATDRFALGISANGSIGIGNSAPAYTLDIKGTEGINPFNVASSSGSSLMVINQNGNVGIGTSSPTLGLLDINGNLALENQSEIRLYQTRGTSNYYAGFKASSTAMTGNTIWSLPNADGTAGKVLATNGSGSLYWTNGGVLNQALTKGYFVVGDDSGLSQATSTIFLSSTGNFGIGTTDPAYSLDVNGTIKSVNFRTTTGNMVSGSGSLTNNSFGHANDENTGFYFPSNDNIGIVTNGTEQMRILASGNVGIGTTSPGSQLQISGVGAGKSSIELDRQGNWNGTNSYVQWDSTSGTSEWQLGMKSDSTNNLYLINRNNAEVLRVISGTQNIAIAGNVGIGTTNPVTKLQVVGGEITLSADQALNFNGTASAANQPNIYYNSTDNAMYFNSGIAGSYFNINGSAGLTVLKNNGNVGIGTTGPTRKLSVVTSDVTGIIAGFGANSTQDLFTIGYGTPSIAGEISLTGSAYGPLTLRTQSNNDIRLIPNGTGNVSMSGNVGIGTTGPEVALHVVGNQSLINTTNPQLRISDKIATDGSRMELRIQYNTAGDYALIDAFHQGTGARPLILQNQGGNVGIGTTTPIGRLEVLGSSSYNSSVALTTGADAADPAIRMYRTDGGGSFYPIAIQNTVNGITGLGDIAFLTGNDNAKGNETLTTRMVIQNGGNVGIGTINPNVKLYVQQSDAYIEPTLGTATGGFFLAGQGGAYGLYSGISGTGNAWLQAMRNDSAIAYALELNPSGGNVGIGTTTPTYGLLDVNGNVALENQSEIRFYQTRGISNYYAGFKASSTAMTGNTIWSLPNADGAAGTVLATNGSGSLYWTSTGGGVTSVDMSVPTGMSISGNPITTTGTLALGWGAGYGPVLTASSTNWNTFYDTPSNRITAGMNLSWNGNTLNLATTTLNLTTAAFASNNISQWNNDSGYITGLTGQSLTKGYLITGNDAGLSQATSTIFLSSTGNFGIGTTAPSALLTVGNSASFQVNSSGVIGLGGATPLFSMGVDSSDSNKFKIYAGSSITGTSQFTIDSTGLTSIANLEMGELAFAQDAGMISWVDMPVSAAADGTIESYTAQLDSNPMITVYGTALSGGVTNLGVGIGTTTPSAKLQVQGNGTGTGWLMRLNDSAGTDRMIVLDNGRVGIGTTSPLAKLEVGGVGAGVDLTSQTGINIRGTSPTTAATTDYPTLMMQNLDTTANNYNRLDFMNSGGYSDAGMAGLHIVHGNSSTSRGALLFYTRGTANGFAERMRIDDTGSVGIGTAAPQSVLDIGSGSAGRSIVWGGATGANWYGTIGTSYSSTALNTLHLLKLATSSDAMQYSWTGTYSPAGIRLGGANVAAGGDIYFFNEASGAKTAGDAFDYASNTKMIIKTNGRVGIGTTTPSASLSLVDNTSSLRDVFVISTSTSGAIFRVNSYGATYADGAYNATGADYAEYFRSRDMDLQPGEVVCVDVESDNSVRRCTRGQDNDVLGIVSTKPSIVGNSQAGMESDQDYKIIGLLGQVEANVSAENGPVRVGDSLTSASSTPGYAMRAEGGDSTVGIAMESLESGTGKIKVLISRRNKSLVVEEVEKLVTDRIAAMAIEDEVNQMIAAAIKSMSLDDKINETIDPKLLMLSTQLTVTQGSTTAEIIQLKNELATISSDLINLHTQYNNLDNLNEDLLYQSIRRFLAGNPDGPKVNINTSTSTPDVAVMEIETASSSEQTAFVVNQVGDGDIADFRSGNVSVMNVASGQVTIVGEMEVDGRIMVCASGACSSRLDAKVDDTLGDLGVEGKVVAGAYEGYCEPGFVWVPGSAQYGTLPGFCVMDHKAHQPLSGDPNLSNITDQNLPYWTKINQGQTDLACQSLGSDYHLMSDSEWLTLAKNITQVKANDIDSSKDGLQLANVNPATASTSIAYQLNNGNTIYDLVGGLPGVSSQGEWVVDVSNVDDMPALSNDWQEYADIASFKYLSNIRPPYYLSDGENQIGKILTGLGNARVRGFVRGYNGVYGLDLSHEPTENTLDIGFRCAK